MPSISSSATFSPEGTRASGNVSSLPCTHVHGTLTRDERLSRRLLSPSEAGVGGTQHFPIHSVSRGILGILLHVLEMGEGLEPPLPCSPSF